MRDVSYLTNLGRGNPISGFPLFSKYQIPGFLKVFLCQIPGTFIQILVIKISKCVKTDRVLTSLVTQNAMYFPGYFQVNAMKSQVNLALKQCLR